MIVTREQKCQGINKRPNMNKGLLFWDLDACHGQDSRFVQKLTKMTGVTFSSIILKAEDHNLISPSFYDLSFVYPVSFRVGSYSMHDALVDVLSYLPQSVNNFVIVIVTKDPSLWLYLLQRVHCSNIEFVTPADISEQLEFAFFPPTVKVTQRAWPSLDKQTSESNKIAPPQMYESDLHEESTYAENFESDNFSADQAEDDDDLFKSPSPTKTKAIKPLEDLERHQIDLRSPSNTPTRQIDTSIPAPKIAAPSENTIEVPMKFKILFESMISIGKSMISLNDLEVRYADICDQYGEVPANLSTLISKASDANLVIFDRSINYVRFRNRSMATAAIVYV